MRRDAPVYAHRAPNGTTTWYVTRYEDVVAVLKDNVHFCKDRSRVFEQKRPSTPNQRINDNMLFADPPDHTRLRALVGQAFTPRRVDQMRPRIEEITMGLLDDIGEHGCFDLISQFALPLPVKVICDMLGIPEVDQKAVIDGSQSIISPGGKGLSYKARRRKVRDFVAYLHDLFAERQRNPQDDMITDLVRAEESGERLSEAELSSMVALLLVTGYETTVNLFGNGVLALLTHRDQQTLLLENPTLWASAVEELLRFDGPVETSTTRWVCKDVVFAGQQMRRGDVMRVVLASANRDEAVFERPFQLDITRSENRHLAFGLGIHYCLGAPLARLEGQIGLQRLFDRFPTLDLAEPLEQLRWRPGVLFRGLESLLLATNSHQIA